METNDLIAKLSKEGASKPLPNPLLQSAKWIIGSLLFLAAVASYKGFRFDIAEKLQSIPFVMESILILLIGTSATIVSFYDARPDGLPKSYVRVLPFIFMVGWLGVIIFTDANTYNDNSLALAFNKMGALCMCHMVAVMVLPAFIVFYFLRLGASVKQGWTATMAVLGISSFSFLFMRYVEPADDIAHILTWHALPILVMCLVAIKLSKSLLRW